MNKNKLITIILILVIIALVTIGIVYTIISIHKNSDVEQASNVPHNGVGQGKFIMLEEDFPKVDGATAMLPMVGEITKAVLGYDDSQAQEYLDENTHGKTAKVYASLINKEKDLIFVSEPSDDILRQAKEAEVEFEMVGIGLDGFVFLINQDNPIKSLTIEQIQKIYTGEITNWSEVGGENAEIIAYQREANSGSQNLMEKMVMKGLKMKEPASTDLMIAAMQGLIDAVSTYKNSKDSIGYSIYLYAKEQYVKDNVKFLAINGVEVTDENIANGSYPLTKIVYAVFRKDEPENSNVRKLVEWLQTEDGQKAVEAGGYVPNKK